VRWTAAGRVALGIGLALAPADVAATPQADGEAAPPGAVVPAPVPEEMWDLLEHMDLLEDYGDLLDVEIERAREVVPSAAEPPGSERVSPGGGER